MDPSPLHLAFCCDGNVADGLVTTIASAATALRAGYFLEIHVIDCGLGADLRAKIASLVRHKLPSTQIEFIELRAERLKHFPQVTSLRHVTVATYGRLFLHELLPGVGRTIYLDTDILVKADLAELYLTPLDGAPLAAVRDTLIPSVGHEWEGLVGSVSGLLPEEAYFNSGVQLLDLGKLRALDASALVAQAVRTVPTRFGDQSLLNAIFHGQWKPLASRWNRQVKLGTLHSVFPDEPRANWHFTSKLKPWHFHHRPARGLLRQWQQARDSVGWTATAVPTAMAHPSFAKDCLRQLRSWIKSPPRERTLT